MILFHKQFVPLILNGTKTRTYRTGNRRWNEGSIHQAKTNYSAGSCFAHLRVTNVNPVSFNGLTRADAIADGFKSLAELTQYLNLNVDDILWEVKFEVMAEDDK